MEDVRTAFKGSRFVTVGVLLISTLVACGDESGPSANSNNGTTATNNGTSTVTNNGTTSTNNGTTVTNNGTTAMTNNGTTSTNNGTTTACEPRTCPADFCGILGDGCGGALDCGVCDCVAGTPTEPGCGPCGIGTTVCGEFETGAGTCDMPIPGIDDLTCDDILFVRAGATSGDGSKAAPFTDLNEALSAASVGAQKVVVIGGETLLSAGPVLLVDGVHVIGGFNEDFTPNLAIVPNVQNEMAGVQDIIGVVADAIDEVTHIKNVNFSTADATEPGANTFGMWVDESNGLVMTDVILLPGRPGDGAPGADGVTGLSGQDGTPGLPGRYRLNAGQASPVQRVGGGGGASGLSCGIPSGGYGGVGAGYASSTSNQLLSASPGGWNSVGWGLPGINFLNTSLGTSGGLGSSYTVVTHGTGGAGGSSALSDVTIDAASRGLSRLAGNGNYGSPGSNGVSGGGGGGAGAYDANTSGPTGGGGGGGGCPSRPGLGGNVGGSSIGLVLINSPGFSFSTEFWAVATVGGKGGIGGARALGGLSGIGGRGGHTLESAYGPTKNSGLKGGNGGNGGAGGSGGPGGGGAGGHSIGVWCVGFMDVSLIRRSANNPGSGGGYIPENGEQGKSLADYGCDQL